jgi:hypothetical protein
MAKVGNYSALDRLLHKLAFASPTVQLIAADCEDLLFGSDIRAMRAAAPIFITSLPRAGTTILLSALNLLPGLGTHLYRDMPFVMAPLLWNRVSRAHRKQAELQERAHGDGMKVGFDSPEAFEEVLWRAFWPQKYTAGGIQLWQAGDADPVAQKFLEAHFRKIVAIRCGNHAGTGRYLSKNNANIARLDYIATAMPEAKILVPVRDPMDHARSLLRQHRNFLAIHARDAFAKTYMADIGHFEFGELHCPILFPGVSELRERYPAGDLDYWLAYWIAAFEHVSSKREQVIAVSYEQVCTQGAPALEQLCQRLGVDPGGNAALARMAAEFRPPVRHDSEISRASASLREHAQDLYMSMTL